MSDLEARIDQAQANGGTAPRKGIVQLVEAQRDQIERALPNGVSPDRIVRVALTTLRTTPKLLQCTPESFLGALMLSAQLGLEPGPLGHAYFVPRYSKKHKAHEVTFLLGYKGLIDLARRSDQVETIEAHEVYETDDFDAEYGTEGYLRHKPNLRRRDGRPWLYYCLCKLRGGGHQWLAMNVEEIEERRKRSSTPDAGPWTTDFDAMARKTTVRALAPFLPLSVHAAQAIARDESVTRGIVTRADLDAAPEEEPEAIDAESEEAEESVE
mgnify:FL=1